MYMREMFCRHLSAAKISIYEWLKTESAVCSRPLLAFCILVHVCFQHTILFDCANAVGVTQLLATSFDVFEFPGQLCLQIK